MIYRRIGVTSLTGPWTCRAALRCLANTIPKIFVSVNFAFVSSSAKD